jgi:ketosteroid isomerase-like protein
MRPWLLLPLTASLTMGAQGLSKSALRETTAAVAAVLDDWHLAAAQSEEERYFSHLAPEAVFLGIDEQERWSKEEFRKWAQPGFQAHQIWNFTPTRRTIAISPSGEAAWFDELLDTTSMGRARGVGVLVKSGGTWLIAQYSLSLPIPRAGFAEVRQVIEALKPPAGEASPKESRPGK